MEPPTQWAKTKNADFPSCETFQAAGLVGGVKYALTASPVPLNAGVPPLGIGCTRMVQDPSAVT